jgi:hypothetical protein
MFLTTDLAIERVALGMIDRSLPKREWTHEGHFAAALWLCRYRPELTGAETIRTLISNYNEATGTPNTDTGGYHHTITLASMHAAQHFVEINASEVPLHLVLFMLMNSQFGKSDWLLSHWSREVLFSVFARHNWVDPDLMPLPF